MQRLTKEQAAVIGAFTGITAGPFSDIHEYAERILGRPVWTHQFANEHVMAELKAAARADFMALVHEPANTPSTRCTETIDMFTGEVG